jgi:hypothetical protein
VTFISGAIPAKPRRPSLDGRRPNRPDIQSRTKCRIFAYMAQAGPGLVIAHIVTIRVPRLVIGEEPSAAPNGGSRVLSALRPVTERYR